MIIKTDAPSPQKYNVPSKDFSDTSKGFIFGISREKYEKVKIVFNISIRYSLKSILDKTRLFQDQGLIMYQISLKEHKLREMASL